MKSVACPLLLVLLLAHPGHAQSQPPADAVVVGPEAATRAYPC